MRISGLPELLAPAGDMDALVAAVDAGADAVYVGGKLYSARSYAKNFDLDEMRRAVAYCHLNGVKLYVTMNTLLYDNELVDALRFARELYLIGVDALIVCDLGLIALLRQYLPELELHASTQMSVHNADGAALVEALGCSRVVLARELSELDMRATVDASPVPCEVFLHGALCVCHSGQCLFSSMVGGRSGNRGECAQPCRLPFYNGGKESYPLSLSDLSLAHHIPALIDMGVASLKIEGRMKSPEYVYTVTSVYRRLLDEHRASTKAEDELLARAFSRGGFTDGYFRGTPEAKMTGVRSEADKTLSRGMEELNLTPKRAAVMFEAEIRLGEPSRLTATLLASGRSVTVYGDPAEPAKNAPLDEEGVKARLSKLGNTYLALDSITVHLDEGVNLSPAAINRLRRLATDAIENGERTLPDREVPTYLDIDEAYLSGYRCEASPSYKRTAVVYNHASVGEAVKSGYFDKVFVPLSRLDNVNADDVGVALPPVITESEREEVLSLLNAARARGIDECIVGNLGHISLATEAGMRITPDFRFNIYNRASLEVSRRLGLNLPMLSPELTLGEAGRVGGREVVYGRIPLMVTERCFIRENFGCERCDKAALNDRRGVSFPIMREFKHRNIIFNSAITYLADKPEELTRVKFQHYIFSTENAHEVRGVIEAHRKSRPLPINAPMRRVGKRKSTN